MGIEEAKRPRMTTIVAAGATWHAGRLVRARPRALTRAPSRRGAEPGTKSASRAKISFRPAGANRWRLAPPGRVDAAYAHRQRLLEPGSLAWLIALARPVEQFSGWSRSGHNFVPDYAHSAGSMRGAGFFGDRVSAEGVEGRGDVESLR